MKRIDIAIAAYCVLLLVFGFSDTPRPLADRKPHPAATASIHQVPSVQVTHRSEPRLALHARTVRMPFR